jgi:hypothetical protein
LHEELARALRGSGREAQLAGKGILKVEQDSILASASDQMQADARVLEDALDPRELARLRGS